MREQRRGGCEAAIGCKKVRKQKKGEVFLKKVERAGRVKHDTLGVREMWSYNSLAKNVEGDSGNDGGELLKLERTWKTTREGVPAWQNAVEPSEALAGKKVGRREGGVSQCSTTEAAS